MKAAIALWILIVGLAAATLFGWTEGLHKAAEIRELEGRLSSQERRIHDFCEHPLIDAKVGHGGISVSDSPPARAQIGAMISARVHFCSGDGDVSSDIASDIERSAEHLWEINDPDQFQRALTELTFAYQRLADRWRQPVR